MRLIAGVGRTSDPGADATVIQTQTWAIQSENYSDQSLGALPEFSLTGRPSSMGLASGTRLGPYEIISPLGAGGMGEVYKARDTRLDRTVAIKILLPQFANDPQFRERFDREARTISQFDHPHICALHDVGEQHGMAYLVMPYLEGETLADRLTKGALSLARRPAY
jgi:serine/threonine protein kinase